MAMLIRIKTMRTSERPLPRCQLLPLVNSCSMTLPMSRILLPPSRSGDNEGGQEGTNTMVMPLMMPGMLKGNHILMKRWKLLAPQVHGGIYNIIVYFGQHIVMGSTIKGRKLYTMPSTMADGVLIMDWDGR